MQGLGQRRPKLRPLHSRIQSGEMPEWSQVVAWISHVQPSISPARIWAIHRIPNALRGRRERKTHRFCPASRRCAKVHHPILLTQNRKQEGRKMSDKNKIKELEDLISRLVDHLDHALSNHDNIFEPLHHEEVVEDLAEARKKKTVLT